MGEVIHGDYSRWANEGTLHSVTNYMLHKALFSGHNDHNYFEIAHTIKYVSNMGGNRLKLYNFVDNHDVERIYTKLNNKAHFAPVHVLLYTLPGIPSIYYGSEFGIEGKKENFSDASLRPALSLEDFKDAINTNSFTRLIAALGRTRQKSKALSYGDYRELVLTNRQYAFSRNTTDDCAIVTVNNDDNPYTLTVACGSSSTFTGALSGERVAANNGTITVTIPANSGEIWLPETSDSSQEPAAPIELNVADAIADAKKQEEAAPVENARPQSASEAKAPVPSTIQEATPRQNESCNVDFEKGKIAGLQAAVIARMEKNGPVTDQMKRDVYNNEHYDSLINWIKSF